MYAYIQQLPSYTSRTCIICIIHTAVLVCSYARIYGTRTSATRSTSSNHTYSTTVYWPTGNSHCRLSTGTNRNKEHLLSLDCCNTSCPVHIIRMKIHTLQQSIGGAGLPTRNGNKEHILRSDFIWQLCLHPIVRL